MELFNKQWDVMKRPILDGGQGKQNNLLLRRKRERERGMLKRQGELVGVRNIANKQIMTKMVSHHSDVIPTTQVRLTPTHTMTNNSVGYVEASQGSKPLGMSTREQQPPRANREGHCLGDHVAKIHDESCSTLTGRHGAQQQQSGTPNLDTVKSIERSVMASGPREHKEYERMMGLLSRESSATVAKHQMGDDTGEEFPPHLHGWQLDDSDSSDDEDNSEITAPNIGRRSRLAPSRSTTRQQTPAVPRVAEWQEDNDVMPPMQDRDNYDSDSVDNEEDEATSAIRVKLGGLAAPRLLSNQPVTGASKERHCLENKRQRQAKQAAQEPY